VTTAAILALLATLALGVAVGLRHLQRARRSTLVIAHLATALLGTTLVALAVLAAPARRAEGPADALPLALLGVALAAGWSPLRLARRRWRGAELVLGSHVAFGIAGFLVFLAWLKTR